MILADYFRSEKDAAWDIARQCGVRHGFIRLPDNGPDFYAARELWCNASWVGPARGFVDPVKEIQSVILALENNLMTYGEAWAERGGDFDEGALTMLGELSTLSRLSAAREGSPSLKHSADKARQEEGEDEDD